MHARAHVPSAKFTYHWFSCFYLCRILSYTELPSHAESPDQLKKVLCDESHTIGGMHWFSCFYPVVFCLIPAFLVCAHTCTHTLGHGLLHITAGDTHRSMQQAHSTQAYASASSCCVAAMGAAYHGHGAVVISGQTLPSSDVWEWLQNSPNKAEGLSRHPCQIKV